MGPERTFLNGEDAVNVTRIELKGLAACLLNGISNMLEVPWYVKQRWGQL